MKIEPARIVMSLGAGCEWESHGYLLAMAGANKKINDANRLKGAKPSCPLSFNETERIVSKRLLLFEHLVILGRCGNSHALSPD